MHFLFVVYMCILQCQLFEFRSIKNPASVRELRSTRSVQPLTILLRTSSSGKTRTTQNTVPAKTSSARAVIKSNEPIGKSNLSENTTVVNSTNDKATDVRKETSQFEDIMTVNVTNTNETSLVKKSDDEVVTSISEKDKDTIENVTASKIKHPESGDTSSNTESLKIEVEPEDPTTTSNKDEVEISSVQKTNKNPSNIGQELSQRSENEAEERQENASESGPAITKNAEVKQVNSVDAKVAEQKTPRNVFENKKILTVVKDASQERNAAQQSESEVESGKDNKPEENLSTSKTNSTSYSS